MQATVIIVYVFFIEHPFSHFTTKKKKELLFDYLKNCGLGKKT